MTTTAVNSKRVHSSKWFILIWIVVGVALIALGRVQTNELILYLAVMGVLVWNRIDSRRKAYKVSLQGLGGTSLTLNVGDDKDGR
jgi:hypothetical protein